MKVFFWQPLLTEHSVHTLNAISRELRMDPVFYVTKLEDCERSSQGWSIVNPTGLRVHSDGAIGRLRSARVLIQNRSNLHFFGSPLENKLDLLLYVIVRLYNIPCVLISEPINDTRYAYFGYASKRMCHKKALRKIYQKVVTLLLGKRSTLLAISEKSLKQYESLGWNRELVIPWGYYVPLKCSSTKRNPSDVLRMIFVGNLIPRKGLDIVLKALSQLVNSQRGRVSLDVYGPGDIERYSEFRDVFTYRGMIQFGDAQRIMTNYDIVVIPSHFDGWGVVVNEAILAGVPAIVSHQVGASSIVKEYQCGVVVAPNSVNAYLKIIEHLLENSAVLKNWQKNCSLAKRRITPDAMAKRFSHGFLY